MQLTIFPITARLLQGYGRLPRLPHQLGTRVGALYTEYSFQARAINRAEYWTWGNEGEEQLHERILREAVLRRPESYLSPSGESAPWDWDLVPAGIAYQVVAEILSWSGFAGQPHPELQERAAAYLRRPEAKTDLIITLAADYRLEELFEMDPLLYQLTAAQAEQKLQLLGMGEVVLELLYPEEFKKVQARQKLQASQPAAGAPGGRRGPHRVVSTESEGGFSATR